MHQKTFERLVNKADEAEVRADELFWPFLLDKYMPDWADKLKQAETPS